MITPGPRLKRKSLKSRYLASMLPMMMLGGSPIMVAVPPTLEKMASQMRKGRGSMFTSLHSLHVTGAISRIVVTLSRNADRTAVTMHSKNSSRVLSPPESLQASTPVHSKTPVRMVMPTMSIMPHSRPSVPWSIHATVLESEGTRFWMPSVIMHMDAPIMAAIVRCSTSVMMRPKTMVMMTAAMPTWMGPVEPSECIAIATACGSSWSERAMKYWSWGSSAISNSSSSACSSWSIE
mmetsp:Transcript_23277/g.55354  ORF Transcript_23277/g.55354 Transcript_23277/m.55354 type:complete len:236 (+) Transcript_23277:1248-1955(+)